MCASVVMPNSIALGRTLRQTASKATAEGASGISGRCISVPVRGTNSRFDKVGWKLEGELHVLACSFKRSENDSREFQKGFELRINIDCADMKILNNNVPPWLRPTVHFAQDGNRVVGKQQRKPCERQVE